MVELVAIAFLGGLITGFSPCIVPVLPVAIAGGSTSRSRTRPLLIVLGLVLSFSATELLATTVLSALGLPQDLLYWLGIALLFLLALGLLVPWVEGWIERPFRRLGATRYARSGGGLVLGLSLGLVFIPCAGPVLAAISVAAAHHRVTGSSVLVTLAYSLGAAIPLLLFALLAQRMATAWSRVRAHLPAVRRGAGVVLAVTTLFIAVGVFDPLQRAVPGYTSALEDHVEGGASVTKQLQSLDGERPNRFVAAAAKAKAAAKSKAAAKAKAAPAAGSGRTGSSTTTKQGTATAMPMLPVLGRAPDFTGIVKWLNTPASTGLTLAGLRGKVVLVDFWTYSCINCQRALPHVEAWYNTYRTDGLVVVGVHTPEFAFEHVVSNVESQAARLGVDYPIAIDSNYGTWDAWGNQYWPAEYLIDGSGDVRAYDFGEGDYSTMESDLRKLLTGDGVTDLPPPTSVPNRTPTSSLSPESYLGTQELQYDVGTPVVPNQAAVYHPPGVIRPESFAFSGTWDVQSQQATAGAAAQIRLQFRADDVYLVMGGTGTVRVSYQGKVISTQTVSGVPRLYTLYSAASLTTGELTISFSPGVQAYDFTFG